MMLSSTVDFPDLASPNNIVFLVIDLAFNMKSDANFKVSSVIINAFLNGF